MTETHQIQISDEVTFFKLHDRNGDGQWDDNDLKALYGFERDVDASAKHIRTIIDRAFHDLDMDGDGLISLTEYMQSKLPSWTPEEIQADKQWRDDHPSGEASDEEQQHHERPEWQEGDHGEEQQQQQQQDDGVDNDPVPDKFKVQKQTKKFYQYYHKKRKRTNALLVRVCDCV